MREHRTIHFPIDMAEMLERTLVLVMTHRSARPYYLHYKTMKPLKVLKTSDTFYDYSDNEGFQYGRGMQGMYIGAHPGKEPHNKEHYDKVFLNFLNEELLKLDKTYDLHRLIFIVPKDIKNITKDKLHNDLFKKAEFMVGNFSKHQPMEILEKIYKEKRHLFPISQAAKEQYQKEIAR